MDIFEMALELVGTAAFAVSGAAVGMRKRMDIFGIIMLGVIIAVGGGVLRDIVLGLLPPTAFLKPLYALTAAAVSAVIFLPPFAAGCRPARNDWNRYSYGRILLDWESLRFAAFRLRWKRIMGMLFS